MEQGTAPIFTQPTRLCLLAHGFTLTPSKAAQAHPELLIPLPDVDALIGRLAAEGFEFVLPNDPGTHPKICSVTFDDGYFNNALFLPLAERHRIPFVLFVASMNIQEQVPFLWDVKGLVGEPWRHWDDDYREAYRHLDRSAVDRLMADEHHRPFTMKELEAFANNPWTHLGLHTHSHQPLVGKFLDRVDRELDENRKLLSAFPRVLAQDLALPCGLYTPVTGRRLLRLVDRIYTCDGGATFAGARTVHRVSLINPAIGGSLMAQVERSFRWPIKLRRKVANIRYSAAVLNRV